MSHIKGGGRAPLSEATEDALLNLLISLREPDKKLTSEHVRHREHRRFLKKLQNRLDRNALSQKANKDDTPQNTGDQLKLVAGQSEKKTAEERKIRIELVEAVFESKKGGKKGGKDFKEGSKKILVVQSSTSVRDLLKDAKSKLRMKKPVDCFIKSNKIIMELEGDLRGIKDDEKVYVTAQPRENKQESGEQAEHEIDDNPDPDPLSAVKVAYRKRQAPRNSSSRSAPLEHPCFTDYLENLAQLPSERESLPAAKSRRAILQVLDNDRVLLVCGATGCGKSTQVPQFLLEGMTAAGQRQAANILVTQPRRVAATALAQRVSAEMGSPDPGKKGSEVGYMVRLDRAVTESAKIVYCTVGILLRMMVCPKEVEDGSGDSESHVPLSTLTHIVIDEVHERDLNTDFTLTLIRRSLAINKNIRIILMSATASAQLFIRYFEAAGIKPACIDIPGRSYQVDIHWIDECERYASSRVKGWSPKLDTAEDPSKNTAKNLAPRAKTKIDNDFIRDLILALVKEQQANGELKCANIKRRRESGAVLVFMPGKREIDALCNVLYQDPLAGDRQLVNILKLHSTIPRSEQQTVFVPAREGTVKIVVASNIAETSITVPDVSHVIDTGRVKESRFNPLTRTNELTTVWTSQASAKQRAGRAGRTSKGACWRLYSNEFGNLIPKQTTAEILRTPLDELVLQLCLLFEHKQDSNQSDIRRLPAGVCPVKFLNNAPEPPPEERVLEACKHLLELGALTVVAQQPAILYRLTPLGYHLCRLPVEAKVGKVLLVGCLLGCLENALTVAAALSNTNSFFLPRFSNAKDADWQICQQARSSMIENGFGGQMWDGGTVKGDSIVTIAVYREYTKRGESERAHFCKKYGINASAITETARLRSQFRGCLQDAGFIQRGIDSYNDSNDDALITSCCLVAGLYPNICTLMRPRKGGPRGGRLLTKDGDMCKPNSNSFQTKRVRSVAESGRDAYAVFHSKHRSVGTSDRPGEVFLSGVDFVSRFALLLFGGQLAVEKNALIVDGWLKFKVGEKGNSGALLIQELRSELDNVMLRHVVAGDEDQGSKEADKKVILMVRQLLGQE